MGVLLGPYLGGLSVLIGNFGAIGLGRPITFVTLPFLDFLPDFVAAVSVGYLIRRQWLPVVILNASLLAVFFAEPLTSIFVTIPGTSISIPFAWMHLAAFAVLLTPLAGKAAKWVEAATKTKQVAAGLAILSLIGTMLQHLTGNILFEVAFGQINPPIIPKAAWPTEWSLVVLAYPVERTILIISAVIVGTPLVLAVTKNSLLKIGKQEQTKTNAAKQPVTS
ncbi:MAG: hypothetical protein ABSA75_11060 [Candidatus Bathyarchaeia archaeon]|jgi:hypothetical protein